MRLVCLLAVCSLFAEPVKFPDDFPVLVEDPADNSEAFAMFYQAGLLPIPPHARAVQIVRRPTGERVFTRWTDPFASTDFFGKLPQSWFWVDEDGTGRLLRGNRMVEGKSVTRFHPGSGVIPPVGDGMLVSDSDLVAETKNLFEALARFREQAQPHDPFHQIPPESVGRQMIHAVRLHETGHTHIANQLTAHLFETIGRRETLLAALSVLVDHEHNHNFQAYRMGGDFAAFIEATEALLEEKQNVWLKRDIVRESLDVWKAVVDARPEPPADFNEAQVNLFNALLNVGAEDFLNSQGFRYNRENWLLAPARLLRGGPIADGENDFIHFLKQAGTDAIPVLAALAESEWYLPLDVRGMGGSSPMIRGFRDMQRQRMLSEFSRPARAADVALQLLINVLPRHSRTRTEADILAAAMDLHHEIDGKSNLEIAWWYLGDAYNLSDAPSAALWTVLASRHEEDLERLRTAILEDSRPVDVLERLHGTPLMEGENGEAFRASLPEKIREIHASDLEATHSWRRRSVERFLTRLEVKNAPPVTLDRVIEEVLSNDHSSLEAFGVNPGGLPETEPGLQRAMLPGLARVTSMEQAESLWHLYQNLAWRVRHQGGAGQRMNPQLSHYLGEEEPTPAADEEEEAWKPEVDVWRPLLENRDTDLGTALAATAAMQFLFRVDSEALIRSFPTASLVTLLHHPPFRDALIEIALHHLNHPDSDLAELLPSADRVSEERREQILSILKGDDPGAVRELLAPRDASEALFLSVKIPEALKVEGAATREVFQESAREIVQSFAPKFGELPVETGDSLTMENLEVLLNHARELAQEGKRGNISFQAVSPFPGLVLTAHEIKLQATRDAGVNLWLTTERGYRMHFPLDRPISLSEPPEKPDTPDPFGMGNDHDPIKGLRQWLAAENIPTGRTGRLNILFDPSPAETP